MTYCVLGNRDAKNITKLTVLLTALCEDLVVVGSVARQHAAESDIDLVYNKKARSKITCAIRKSRLKAISLCKNNWTFKIGDIQVEILSTHAGPEWCILRKHAKKKLVLPFNVFLWVAQSEDAKINPWWAERKRVLMSSGCIDRECGVGTSQHHSGGSISQRCKHYEW